jgi:uncharacterized protein YhdP
VRVSLITLAAASLLATVALFTYALTAASVPESRATLENLVHAETGLDVRFTELRLRWGWYGPEAVFRSVELREPGAAHPLLTAPQLVLGVDLWRMLRSGDLGVSRITLVDPDIDVTDRVPARAARTRLRAAPASPARLLARWRGTRIDVEGGTLHADAADLALEAGIRRIQLRRTGTDWNADALLTLPDALGTTAEAALRLHGDAAQAAGLAGTLTLSCRRVQLALALAPQLHATRGLPAGYGQRRCDAGARSRAGRRGERPGHRGGGQTRVARGGTGRGTRARRAARRLAPGAQ